ncbi:hypothetical protein DYB37_005441 [Aphanomyces astaci]|uniref:Nas2 N-terminal domain-containing protein n=1 Tax=Aphanomyces astaci TaxID=112090 RepID=A0A3R7AY55_APHAT|nr:hypothetical protein DYB35_002156 [Aphanomyces astaci]RHZ17155.1 hypothetical protein DYB37_005441 [Aphanomyces astaci]
MERFQELDKERAAIDAEIQLIVEELTAGPNPIGLKGPLVDDEGFPRSDIDVYTVRHKRHRFACLQNDLKWKMQEIEDVMTRLVIMLAMNCINIGKLHAADVVSDSTVPVKLEGNAGSPSSEAGLQVGDLVLEFGTATADNHRELAAIREIVMRNLDAPIEVVVQRRGAVDQFQLSLVPHSWIGQGVLGCHIVPLHVFTLFMEFIPSITNIILVGQMQTPNLKQYVDATAMAVMVCYTNITSYSVGLGMATALDTLCTQAYGAGNLRKFGVLLQSALLGMALTLVPVTLLNWFSGDILKLLGQEPALANLTGAFIRVMTVGYPALYAFEVLKKLVQAEGVTTPMAVLTGLGNILHVSMGYYLSQHTFLGYLGPAVALTVMETAVLLGMLGYVLLWNTMYTGWCIEWGWHAAWSHVAQFFQFGVPGMLMMMIEWGAIEILTLVAGILPNHILTIGVNSVLTLNLAYMPYFGLSVAATIRMGTLLGANQPDKAKRVMFLTLRLCFACALLTASAIVLLSPVLPRLVINDVDVIAYVVYRGFFRAMGKQDVASGVNAAAFYLVGVPVAVLFGVYLEWSVEGLWAGFTFGSLTAFVVYQLLLCRVNWAAVAQDAVNRE